MARGISNVIVNMNLNGLDENPAWYTITTMCNYEDKVLNAISQLAARDTNIYEAFVPFNYEKITKVNKNGKVTSHIKKTKGAMSTYVFVKAKLSTPTWNALRNCTGVKVILSPSGTPASISEEEIEHIRNNQQYINMSEDEIQAIKDENYNNYCFIKE